jgi:hypothetical protein
VRTPDVTVGGRGQPLGACIVLALALAVACCSATAADAGGRAKRVVIYSVAKQEQYVNNADDRTRGQGHNPFGNYKDTAPVIKPPTGPFPGDEAIFAFALFSDAGLRKKAGSAVFMCYYNFGKNAYCDASFHLSNGATLMASGAFNFNAPKFTLAITGGYGPNAARSGVVEERPAANHSQRLVFLLD